MSSTSLTPPPSEDPAWRTLVPSLDEVAKPITVLPTCTAVSSTSVAETSDPSKRRRPSIVSVARFPRRAVKRVREATPIDIDEDNTSLGRPRHENASLAAYTTTAAGPSSYRQEIDNPAVDTSEGGEVDGSVLFSEQTGKGQAARNDDSGYIETALDTAETTGDFFPEEDEEEGGDEEEPGVDGVEDDEGDFKIEEEEPPQMDESHDANDLGEDDTQTLPPAWLEEPPLPPDRMSRILERRPNRDMDDGTGSYHSGDSSEFEMDHRPILERTAIKRDIKIFADTLDAHLVEPETGMRRYRVVDRLGEGTFSSVYMAYDVQHHKYDNEFWTDEEPIADMDEIYESKENVRVALKRILATSSPVRIQNELHILESLRGCRNVSQLITAFREEDQVIIVLPYHRSDDFRHFYKHMDTYHIRSYMQALLRALKDIHQRGIVHRDVKPANFLFDYETCEGVLCDFGLAERYVPTRHPICQHGPATLSTLQGTKIKTADTNTIEQAVYDARKRSKLGEGRVGFPQEDKRPQIRTNRAGTRGFRAPEVLLKCPDQTVAIDVWSTGVMLLSILTHKFPVFNSNDDIEALMEIAAIFGRAAMERCALLHNRTIISNAPTLDTSPSTLQSLILKLNPHIYTPPMLQPTPADAQAHIEGIDQAIDLCLRLLRLDSTKRITSAAALRHPFFKPLQVDAEGDGDLSDTEVLAGSAGKCGHLHGMDGDKHRAYFHDTLQDMGFGQGIPSNRTSLCPEHEHWQQRLGYNPLAVSTRWDEDGNGTETETNMDADEGEEGLEVEKPLFVDAGLTERERVKGAVLREKDMNVVAKGYGRGRVIGGL